MATSTYAGRVTQMSHQVAGTFTAGAGPATLSLDWANSSANLSLFLKTTSGVELARAVTANKPETITYDLPAAGKYRIVVRAVTGNTDFVCTINHADVPPPIDPPPIGGPVNGAGNLKPFSLQFMEAFNENPTEADAVTMANAYDVIVAHTKKLTPHLAAMRAANPNVKVYVYNNATFTWHTDLTDAWYCKDANGKRITAKGWAGTYLMRPDLAGYKSWFNDDCDRLLAESGYDGMYLDVLGPASLDPNYVTGVPINPATSQPYTRDVWLANTGTFARDVVTYLAPKPVLGNGSVNGQNWYRATGATSALDGTGMVGLEPESWLRGGTSPLTTWPSETAWKQNVDMVADGITPTFTVTKVWVTAPFADKERWHDFAIASFLLGNTGDDQFHFSYEKGDGDQVWPRNDVQLGDAAGHYFKAEGAYQREFTLGRVLVNPTAATVTVPLPPNSGYPASITLPEHRSAILYKTP